MFRFLRDQDYLGRRREIDGECLHQRDAQGSRAADTDAVGQIARSPITHSGLTASHVGLLVAWIVIFGIGTAVLFRRDTARA